MTSDLDSTLSSIDEVAVHHCGQCDEPLEVESLLFCSEVCQKAWNLGIKGRLAPTTVEWRHPHRGEVVEPLCDAHSAQVRGALRLLAIGHAASWTDPPAACSRCSNSGEVRGWIDRFVVRRIDSRGSR